MSSHRDVVSVHVEADVCLARAGLTRAAHRAGLEVVGADLPAAFTLRAVTLPAAEPALDVYVGSQHVQIVVHGAPTRREWDAILPLLEELAADTTLPTAGC